MQPWMNDVPAAMVRVKAELRKGRPGQVTAGAPMLPGGNVPWGPGGAGGVPRPR